MVVPTSRRRALSSAVTAGLSLPLLAACGDDEGGSVAGDRTTPTPTATTPPATPPDPPSEEPFEGDGAQGVVATGGVPVGGGVVLADAEVVVTQPAAGEFKVFTAVCTHAGCLVGAVTDTIDCPCHRSTFDISTGAPTGGPAPSALDPVAFVVDGDQVVLS